MKVLYVTGACLTKNTSANMSHNAFVKGLLDNGCDVEIVMANDSWGEEDSTLKKWDNVKYYEFNSVSFADRLRKNSRNIIKTDITDDNIDFAETKPNLDFKAKLRQFLKSVFYKMFPQDNIYPINKKWLKSASKFKSNIEYDLVISNSSPSASHKLVVMLNKSNRIKYNRWVQIWEDPWYYDLYGGMPEEVKEEEHYLLREASEVYYVSPLTLMYQKKYFSDCAEKMKCVPLPFLEYTEKSSNEEIVKNSFGYFGDYYSVTRNLQPFYNALLKSGFKGYIYGDTDLNLSSTDNIEISGRVTLNVLSGIQDKTEVLVHLCNLKGGQIPGKIYHYSATTKPILFILDGTEEEKKALYEFFKKYGRYYFCENNEETILVTMEKIGNDSKNFNIVTAFSPKEVVKKIICDEKNTIY